jgi:hypothetical protein
VQSTGALRVGPREADPMAKRTSFGSLDPETRLAQAPAPQPLPLPLTPALLPAPTPTNQTIVVVPPRGPTVNVSVPITNPSPDKWFRGVLHHRQSTKPGQQVSPARGPFLERLMGQP